MWLPSAAGAGGYPSGVRQIVSSFSSALSSTTAQIPGDDTIPQSNEGAQFLSVSITPQSSTSSLWVGVVVGAWTSNTIATGCGAIFRDTGANALAAALAVILANGTSQQFQMSTVTASGSTSTTTFKYRMGLAGGNGTMNFNGYGGPVRYFGGACSSGIVVMEFGA